MGQDKAHALSVSDPSYEAGGIRHHCIIQGSCIRPDAGGASSLYMFTLQRFIEFQRS
jgi:hypothetical protein